MPSYLILCIATIFVVAIPARCQPIPVCSFDSGVLTEQGGVYLPVVSGESTVNMFLDNVAPHNDQGRSLRIEYARANAGDCALRLNLYNDELDAKNRPYPNVVDYPYLEFAIKGAVGGEEVTVELTDAVTLAGNSRFRARPLSEYLGAPMAAEWQRVTIPYADFGASAMAPAALFFSFRAPARGTIYLDDIQFSKTAESPRKVIAAPPVPVAKTPPEDVPATVIRRDSAPTTPQTAQPAPQPTPPTAATTPIAKADPTAYALSSDGCTLLDVWNFDRGIQTRQKGYYNHFGAAKSEASVHLVDDVFRGVGGRSCKINYSRQEEGFCGVWFHLFEDEAVERDRRYISVADYPYLSFWVKGQSGGEEFSIQMADPSWLRREDSKSAGLVTAFLDGPVTTEWQEVVVPYHRFMLASYAACSVVFNFTKTQTGTIYIDDLTFKSTKQCPVPVSNSPQRAAQKERALSRAMWAWNIEPLLLDAGYREAFLLFCQQNKIDELFLQMPYRFERDHTPEVECVILHAAELRGFLRTATANGIRAHALDGYPEFCLTEQHPRVLAQVHAIMEFNRQGAADERYTGIHLDNEPYQLLGFNGPHAETILLQFLDLNSKVMKLLRENSSDLVYGIDIPFWFDESKHDDGALKYLVTYNGARKDMAKHLIDIVDNVGIMNYRNFAGGADGMIKHGIGEVAYADQLGKKIFLGVETFKYAPANVSFIYAPPSDPAAGGDSANPGMMVSTFEQFPVRALSSQNVALIGLVQPVDLADRARFNDTVSRLYGIFGATVVDPAADVDKLQFAAKNLIRNDGGFEGFHRFDSRNFRTAIPPEGFDTTENMHAKITFAGKTKGQMEEALRETANALVDYPNFAGFAIHYYETYRSMPD